MKKAIVLLAFVPTLAFGYQSYGHIRAPLYDDNHNKIVTDKPYTLPMRNDDGEVINGRVISKDDLR